MSSCGFRLDIAQGFEPFTVCVQPQVDPAYTVFETAIIGTGGLNALGAGEAAVRTVFEVCC
jgi:hypothetical protein